MRSTGVYSTMLKDAALAEKTEPIDLEENAIRIAQTDLNRKKKQV